MWCYLGCLVHFPCIQACCAVGRTRSQGAPESPSRVVTASHVEEPDPATLTPTWRPQLLLPGANRNALTDQERREYAMVMRRALQEVHLSIQVLMSQEPSSQDVSGVEEID